VPMVARAMREGAFDFLQKPFNEQVLLDRVQEAVQFAAAQRAARGWLAEIQARIDSLTARESDVMAGMVAGRLNKQIAEGLGISIKTVEQHRARVMEKLQVDSLAELVRLVVGVGWSAESKNGQ
nr:DNA-binding response regulator [Zoogloea sp.]